MGKGTRNKNNASRVEQRYAQPQKYQAKKTKGANELPRWMYILAIAFIAFIVIASVSMSAITKGGVILRSKTAMKSEHYEIDGMMMQYYYNAKFQETYQTYYNIAQQYFGNGNQMSIFGFTYDSAYAADNEVQNKCAESFLPEKDKTTGRYDSVAYYLRGGSVYTWWDYFMDAAIAQAKEDLVYCDLAYNAGFTTLESLDADAPGEIEKIFETLEENRKATNETRAAQGYTTYKTFNSYIASLYGNGVKKDDIRNAVTLSYIADLYEEKITDAEKDKITDENVNEEYKENGEKYNITDYLFYDFTLDYDDILEGFVDDLGKDYTNEEHKEAVEHADYIYENAKALIEELVKEFDTYKKDNAENKKMTEAIFKELVLKAVGKYYYEELVTDKNKPADKTKDQLVQEAYDAAMKAEETPSKGSSTTHTLLEQITYKVYQAKDALLEENAAYQEGTDAHTWMFVDGAIAGDFFYSVTGEDSKTTTYPEVSEKEEDKDDDKDEDGKEEGTGEATTEEATTEAPEADTSKEEGSTDSDKKEEPKSEHEGKSYSASFYFLLKTPEKEAYKAPTVGYILFDAATKDAKALAEAVQKLFTEGMTKEQFEELIKNTENIYGGAVGEDILKEEFGYDEFDEYVYAEDRKKGDNSVLTFKKGEGDSAEDEYYCAVYVIDEGKEAWAVKAKDNLLTEAKEEWVEKNVTPKLDLVNINTKTLVKVGY